MPALSPLAFATAALFPQVSTPRKMMLADRYGLLAVLLHSPKSEEALYCIDRVLYALRKGRIHAVDTRSTAL